MNTPPEPAAHHLVETLRSSPGPSECWHCGEWGCGNADEELETCGCTCHAWRFCVQQAADEIEKLVAQQQELELALEHLKAQSGAQQP